MGKLYSLVRIQFLRDEDLVYQVIVSVSDLNLIQSVWIELKTAVHKR